MSAQMQPIIEAMKPLIILAVVAFGIEIIVNLLFSGKKKSRYQSRKRANDREHAKVTQKMRYDVLHRDGFRCVKCGRSKEDGVKLHIDHIKPISRGGKSKMSNLQTLCEDCNMGKGNKYIE